MLRFRFIVSQYVLSIANVAICSTKKLSKIAVTRSTPFSSKCTSGCLVAGLYPDPLEELKSLPRLPSWIKGAPKGERGVDEGG